MKTYRVEFKDVGRRKMSWGVNMQKLSLTAMLSEIRRKQALVSNDIDFRFSEDGKHGEVWAGVHRVGLIEVQEIAHEKAG